MAKNNEPDDFDKFIEEFKKKLETENGEQEKPFDFRSLSYDHKTSYKELIDVDKPFHLNVIDLFKKFIILHDEDRQLPLFISYALLNSAICTTVPILLLCGYSGTGKSEASKFISKIHDSEPIQANATYASLRNYINAKKFPNRDLIECDCCLIWEDISPSFLIENDFLYSMLKSGVNILTGKTTIAKPNGENIEFNTFSPKVISTIHKIYSDSRLEELKRRIFLIEFKKAENISDLLSIDDFDWYGINQDFNDFWKTKAMDFIQIKKSLKMPKSFNVKYWQLSKDIISCSLVCDFYSDRKSAIEAMSNYWLWYEEKQKLDTNTIESLLDEWISEQTNQTKNKLKSLSFDDDEIQQLILSSKELKGNLIRWKEQGLLDNIPIATIEEIMLNKGWKLTPRGYIEVKQ